MADDVSELNGAGGADSDETAGGGGGGGPAAESAASKRVAKHDCGAADLERVTDYVEEKEILSNSEQFKGAMSIIGDKRNKEVEEKMAKERELLKVAISKDDVDLIVKEFEIPRTKAERVLREHMGNVVEAMITLAN